MPYQNSTFSEHGHVAYSVLVFILSIALCMALAKLHICIDSFEPLLVAIKSKS